MTKFVVGRPLTTTTPTVEVDAGLAFGPHRFRLTVVDSSGNTSEPAEVTVAMLYPGDVPRITSPTVTRTRRKAPAKPPRPAR